MNPGDLILIPDYFEVELCLVVKVQKKNDQIEVFNSIRNRMELYRLSWAQNSVEKVLNFPGPGC